MNLGLKLSDIDLYVFGLAITFASIYAINSGLASVITFEIPGIFIHQAHPYTIIIFAAFGLIISRSIPKEAIPLTAFAAVLFDAIGGLAGGIQYVLIAGAIVQWDLIIFVAWVFFLRKLQVNWRFLGIGLFYWFIMATLQAPFQASSDANSGYALEALMEIVICGIIGASFAPKMTYLPSPALDSSSPELSHS